MSEKLKRIKIVANSYKPGPNIFGVEDICWLIGELEEALRLLREGKAEFAPHTTNSVLDDFLEKYSKYKMNMDKPKCEHCGTELIDDCLSCGAPQCCPACCEEQTRQDCFSEY